MNSPLYIGFSNYEKAFDSIDMDCLRKFMKEYTITQIQITSKTWNAVFFFLGDTNRSA